MRILNLPGPAKPSPTYRWWADRLQFALDGSTLLLERTDLGHRNVGQLDLATGRWEAIDPHENFFVDEMPSPLPWRRDFSCVVMPPYESGDGGRFEMYVVDPKDLQHKPSIHISRIVVTGQGVGGVEAFEFSADGRWLYGVEQWREGRSQRSAIVRADIRALLAKRVIEQPSTNRLTGQTLIHRFVQPTTFARLAALPQGVDANVLGVSPDGRLVAIGSSWGEAHLFRVRGGDSIGILKSKRRKGTQKYWVRRIAFSPSGKQLGVVAGGVLKVWDTKTTKLIWDTEAEKVNAIDLAYHPDGKTLAVVRQDGTAWFVDATNGTMRKRYDWKVGQLNSVAFSPDGLTCAAGGEKGRVVVWDVDC